MPLNSIKNPLRSSIAQYLYTKDVYEEATEIAMAIESNPSVGEVRSFLTEMVRDGEVLELDGKYSYLLTKQTLSLVTNKINPPLTEQERGELELLKNNVNKGFYVIGASLGRIRNKRLFREKYDTFEEFCQNEFGHSRQYVNYLISGAEITEDLKTAANPNNKFITIPTSETQVRPLANLAKEERINCWNIAVERSKGKVPTAKIVKQVVREREQMEVSAKYRLEQDRLRCGTVVRISGKNNPGLKVFHNCWAEIVGVNENSYDLVAWNGAKKEVHRNDFTVLPKADPELARSLLTRLSRIRFQLEESQKDDVHLRGFLSYLGTQECPELTPWSEKILSQTEAVFESD